MNIGVLGTGLVGSAIVKDLAQEPDFNITAADLSPKSLAALPKLANITPVQANLQNTERVTALIADADLVICAVPGFMGFATLKAIIATGKNVVDISFFPEDAFLLDEEAKERGVTAIVDCGVAPGLCNILAGHVDTLLEHTERYVCYVGGLPKVRHWPYEYQAVFSPSDVLEEYTRPARYVEFGREVVRPALSDVELLDFPGVDTLEAFNTDGLRSLIRTLDAPFMKEKTLRYPGHAGLMRILRESGFFDSTPLNINGQKIRPLDVTSRLLFDKWALPPGEEDFTVMRVVVEGKRAGQKSTYTYDLLDHYDKESHTTSMARTTGYTCTIVARQVLQGLFTQKGICPPEFIGRTPGCYEALLAGYAQRNIRLREQVQTDTAD